MRHADREETHADRAERHAYSTERHAERYLDRKRDVETHRDRHRGVYEKIDIRATRQTDVRRDKQCFYTYLLQHAERRTPYIHLDTVPADKVQYMYKKAERNRHILQARNQIEPQRQADRRKDRQRDVKTGKET